MLHFVTVTLEIIVMQYTLSARCRALDRGRPSSLQSQETLIQSYRAMFITTPFSSGFPRFTSAVPVVAFIERVNKVSICESSAISFGALAQTKRENSPHHLPRAYRLSTVHCSYH